MQRFLKNYGNLNKTSESIVSNDYNWDELSIGEDTLGGDRFFGLRREEAHNFNEDLNNVEILFEDTDVEIKEEIVENIENMENMDNNENNIKELNSIDSDNLSSSLDEVHIDTNKKIQSKKPCSNVQKPMSLHNPKVPNVYLAGQLYELRKKHRMEQLERDEREKRKFYARPAPNFSSIHAAQSQKRSFEERKITMPITPKVVHTHRENMKKIRAKQSQLEEARKPKPFISKEAEVLFKAPFVPQQHKKPPTEQAPFNLQSNERLRERRQFDEQIKQETERKEREQEEKRKAEDEQIRREIRKATTFKAKPNPFS